MFDLKTYLNEKRQRVDDALTRAMTSQNPGHRLVCAMKHSLMAGGKRIRPVLCLAAVEAVDGNPEHAMSAACALEMIHTYSLIHDDLPAMDDDELRRGLPTCHVAFDEATAILAGDALLTLAFEILAANAVDSRISAHIWFQVIRDIAAASGPCGMIEGQMRDLAAEQTAPSREGLEQIHALKTGAIIEASVVCGARLGNATDMQIDALRRYAQKIGLAFQVTDDLLNVTGDPEVMGKAAGTDAERHKTTYPSLMGHAASEAFAAQLIETAIDAISEFGAPAEPLRAIARYIVERKR